MAMVQGRTREYSAHDYQLRLGTNYRLALISSKDPTYR